MPTNIPQFMANGNISPGVFCKIDTTSGADNKVVQATAGSGSAGDPIIGVSNMDTDRAPLSDLITTQYHAQAGEPAFVHPVGDVCLLLISATVTQGQRLKSDANGNGTPTTTDGDFAGAIALESGASGAYIKVQVLSPSQQVAA